MYTFKSPKQKKNYYVCNINEKLTINLNDIKIKNLQKINNSSGYIIDTIINNKINNDDINIIKNIDTSSLNSILNNKEEWFNDDLDNDKIQSLYIKSYIDDNINIILPLDLPIDITINNENIDDINILLNILKDFKNIKNYVIDITIAHYGLYFYPKYFINKWIIKKIDIINNNDIYDDNGWNKEDIELEWKNDINIAFNNIDKSINDLIITKEKINILYNEIINIKTPDNLWENKLMELKCILNKL